MNRVKRMSEDILAWLNAARQRKKDWEKEVEVKWAAEEQRKKSNLCHNLAHPYHIFAE